MTECHLFWKQNCVLAKNRKKKMSYQKVISVVYIESQYIEIQNQLKKIKFSCLAIIWTQDWN